MADMIGKLAPGLNEDAVRTLTAYAVAGADGLFVHREIHGDSVDLAAMFDLRVRLGHDVAVGMAAGSGADADP
ncbi:hypothetical protein [Streptomyces sp. P17]|uniref:hypothetical protein n=1 Tax=Streptomyces sp. P17 TaxID=3074716 RepID=UPI0028F411E7|nr:hypothetical protein [Streptomyces sp. P17]MDT9696862.1 hypothetical protein [Streptomyces sp. P17]